MAIFGPDGEDFISGGDQVRDKNNGIDFAKEASAKNSIVMLLRNESGSRRWTTWYGLDHDGRFQSESGNHHRWR